MSESSHGGNGHGSPPTEILEMQFPRPAEPPHAPLRMRRRPLWPALILFLLTVLSTLAVGVEFAQSYAQNQEPFSSDQNPFAIIPLAFQHPGILALGIPFSFTLLAI